ncbi:phage tail protein [Burkholderia multivorans]|uniref:phage tail protein n=1 Tax=Burkholderia multivorans TaxID=87883 RepID=UPI0020194C85|nr:phage tail protein [Burkholderia multivorans]MCL4664494.1 phage tail protein [Burkholderia multivorans]MCO1355888.1 phage tail protein [Burkholderia multivorans]MCO1415928.1 phage tail protein [Burkholderia multivorans]MCO1449870.1 phage tail protein [Burkholderia multivorans]UQP43377.1 phage tail protein [Burkholderia multivorans]
MTDTFNWSPTVEGFGGDTTLRVRKARFGDGYTQRAADGLNNRTATYNLRFVGRADMIDAILAFLDAHAGSVSFFWTPPLRPQGRFVCEKYSEPVKNGEIYTITAQFEETFAP